MASSSLSQSFGFQHGRIYKITSVKDNCSIEVENGSIEPGTRIITGKSKDISRQKFKTEQVEDAPGEFRVSGLDQPTDIVLVWDFIPGQGLVIHDAAHEIWDQKWTTERVYPGRNEICFIKSRDGKCLRNEGKGKQLKLVPQKNEKSQYWTLKPASPY